MDQKFDLLKPGLTVLDLGASPGGWSPYACSTVGGKGEVFAVDMLEIQPITGVRFLKLDLSDADTAQTVADWMVNAKRMSSYPTRRPTLQVIPRSMLKLIPACTPRFFSSAAKYLRMPDHWY